MDSNTTTSFTQAINQIRAGNQEQAREILVGILRQNPDHEPAWFALSFTVSDQAGKTYALQQVLRLNPDHEGARRQLGLQETSALPQIPSKKEALPPKPESRLSTAQALIDQGRQAAAQNLLRNSLIANPQNDAAWYLLSQTTPVLGLQKALLRQTLRVNPQQSNAHAALQELDRPSEVLETAPKSQPDRKLDRFKGLIDFSKYSLKKLITLFVTVVIGVFLTILVANMGGYVDEIMRGMVAQQIMGFVMGGGLDDIPDEDQDAYLENMEWGLEESMGLHDPFILRTVRWLFHGLTLNLGEARLNYFFKGILQSGNRTVQEMVLERLPFTLILVGVGNIVFFFTSIFVALFLSRKYGSWLDRMSAVLAALSSAPSWIYGILLILILAAQLRWLPFPVAIDLQYADYSPRFLGVLAKQLIMPVLAIFLSVFFQGVYAWRTFFLIYSQEDYVEMAKAMGLSDRAIERKYILRPTFPYVITNFAMMMITLWETAIALELLFHWPGIGQLFLQAVTRFNSTSTPIIVAIVVIFAYILAITVFVLDLVYGLVDPKVRIGTNNNQMVSAKQPKSWGARILQIPTLIFKGITEFGRVVGSFPSFMKSLFLGVSRPRGRLFSAQKSLLKELRRYPSALVGLLVILILIGVSVYTVFALPYNEAVVLWRTHTVDSWEKYPRNASPAWTNWFRTEKLPETMILDSRTESVSKTYEQVNAETTDITVIYEFDYDYAHFPEEFSVFFESEYSEKLPHVALTWLTPDQREIRLSSFSLENPHIYRIVQDDRLQRRLRGVAPQIGLFADPNLEEPTPLKGRYQLKVSGIVFESDSDFEADFVLYGRVHGVAGTDHHRRDLKIALLWGTPVALAFGLLGAVGTGLAAMFISAFGVWYGGWVDNLIQRITEINIILPTLPIAVMIYIMYSKSIWAILGVIVLLNIFGSSIKNYRAAFLQVKEAAYIEGAQAYGAGNRRIVFHYLIPRIIPILLPQLVIMVPGYVFYEATLAYLGLSDPYLPTWGKVVFDAFNNSAHLSGHYYWILEPIGLLVTTGLAFALFGFALDRVINPRLREA
jgi:peptide/nickel transport system permease protein